ncbi:MAG TPA: YsnF/AvaK domain-containing protein [Pseudolabrys sp.]|nr:YsnF/AvaK domain-containing protein [Pseudolabrys sp.]
MLGAELGQQPQRNAGKECLVNPKHGDMIPVLEERAHIRKRKVSSGRVRVRVATRVASEFAKAKLREEHAEVVRVPVNREVDKAPVIRTENGVTIVPVLEETLVVEKRLVLKEELHIRRRSSSESVQVPVQLRKQEAVIEKTKAQRQPKAPGHSKQNRRRR